MPLATSTAAFSQLLLLYTWFVLAAVLFFLLLIARFYQKFSGENTHFRWFILPIVLYGGAAMRYASIDHIGGDIPGDALLGSAGLVLAFLCIHLYRQMTAGRKPL
jgi:hypothetical protein